MLAEQQLEAEGGLISIQREISTGERNLCRVCGVIVPLAFLRRLTALLVDVHGQHAHQSLLDAKNHMAFLDSFGDAAFEAQKRRVEEQLPSVARKQRPFLNGCARKTSSAPSSRSICKPACGNWMRCSLRRGRRSA